MVRKGIRGELIIFPLYDKVENCKRMKLAIKEIHELTKFYPPKMQNEKEVDQI